jgi:hypothetical protein
VKSIRILLRDLKRSRNNKMKKKKMMRKREMEIPLILRKL